MKILELLAQSQRGLTLSDISRKLGIPKSSAHVLIKTLEVMGYLKSSKNKWEILLRPETGQPQQHGSGEPGPA